MNLPSPRHNPAFKIAFQASKHPLGQAFLDALFPPRCAGCRQWSRDVFCPECASHLRPIQAPLCQKCGAPFDPLAFAAPICASCRSQAPHFMAARSGFHFDGPLREAIHHLKYHEKIALAERLAPLLAQTLSGDAMLSRFLPQLIVPIPLHPKRLKERGFNQSFLLAIELGALLDVPVVNGLRRTRNTPPQIQLNREDRARNVRGAFDLNLPALKTTPLPTHILLIDDVFTTGATLGEAARTLRHAGVQEICALTLARQA